MIEVLKSGLQTSIQDLGRFGYRNYGVPNSGCMDLISAGFANLLLNNSKDAAVLEITLIGPKLRFLVDTIIAITGAEIKLSINNTPISNNKAYRIKKDDILSFGKLTKGARTYLAVKNGIKSEVKLASRSQFSQITKKSCLEKGDCIEIEQGFGDFKETPGILNQSHQFYEANEIEVLPGPEFRSFSKKEISKSVNTCFSISSQNNRMGYQMNESVIPNTISMITSPVIPGTVQVLPSGNFVFLMRDSQTTGGYPRIFQLTEKSISILAQKKTGDPFYLKLKNYYAIKE